MKANAFLLCTLIYGLIVCSLVVGVNYVVDPYGITGAPRTPGFNEQKVDINEHTKVVKKYQRVARVPQCTGGREFSC
jgi:hypothetical protein